MSELLERVARAQRLPRGAARPERTIEAQGRIENLQELVGVAREYQETAEEPSLSHFLQEISLYSDQDAIRGEESLVTLMTLHNAKGLEFRAVLPDRDGGGIFPHARSIEEQGIEEERTARVRRHDACARAAHAHARLVALALGLAWLQPAVALPRRAADARSSANGCGRHRGRRTAPRASRRARTCRSLSTGDSVRHGTLGEGVVTQIEAGRRRHRSLRGRKRAAADARLRALSSAFRGRADVRDARGVARCGRPDDIRLITNERAADGNRNRARTSSGLR